MATADRPRTGILGRLKAGVAWLVKQVIAPVVRAVVGFLRRHREFTESAATGCVAALVLRRVPLVGSFLASCAVTIGIVAGLIRELWAAADSLYDPSD